MLHNLRMDYPKVLRDIMSAGELNQSELARRLRVTQPTISRWLNGDQEPRGIQHQRIEAEAARLQLEGFIAAQERASDEFESDDDLPTVPVKGYVSAGQAHYLPLPDEELDRVPAPDGSTSSTIALEIRGTSLGELFDRWLVFFDQVRTPVTPDLIGKTCVVGLADGRVLVKKLKRAGNGLFDLYSNTEEPIRGVVVEWAARVKIMAPR